MADNPLASNNAKMETTGTKKRTDVHQLLKKLMIGLPLVIVILAALWQWQNRPAPDSSTQRQQVRTAAPPPAQQRSICSGEQIILTQTSPTATIPRRPDCPGYAVAREPEGGNLEIWFNGDLRTRSPWPAGQSGSPISRDPVDTIQVRLTSGDRAVIYSRFTR